MQRSVFGLAIALVVAVVAAACGSTKTVTDTTTVTAPATSQTGLGPPGERVEFGHIKSLTRKGDHFELRFDPAWFLSGETANSAAAEDGAVAPGEPVPNDNYVVEEGHRLLTYLVPDDAKVTVLTRGGDPAQLGATPITVSELARIVQATSSLQLFEPLETGVWIMVDVDTVRAIDQQYRP
ncbi:MAG: hypothetical protein ABI717_04310 [Actinomycetota bacterium]